MAFQALYRRYRPQRFGEVKGQDHVVAALRGAVRDDAVGHAYLFSGPRGTGKTSTARILAKALNCEDLQDGEPCGVCAPCKEVEAGSSMAVVELDAASNNGVDAMRDLTQRAALASTGRTKVYIVDEVHMLSTAASNALLKTLEEPPGHVVFVLATTDPHKVLPTIRSRTQHFDFRLLGAPLLGEHLRSVVADAGLEVSDAAIDRAVRKGDGSARDALSALDQLVASGGEGEDDTAIDEVVEGLCERDTARALGGVATACGSGRDPRTVASGIAAHLRDALLSLMAPDLVSLPDAVRDRVADQARRLGAPALVKALEAVGDAVLALPNAPDPRVTLEVALVKVTRPEADTSTAGILERLERLERADRQVTTAAVEAASPLASGGGSRTGTGPAAAAAGAPAPRSSTVAGSTGDAGAATDGGATATGPAARPALGAIRRGGARRSPADAGATDAPANDAPAAGRRGTAGPATSTPEAPGTAAAGRTSPPDPTPSDAPTPSRAPAGTAAEPPDAPGHGEGGALPSLAEVESAWAGRVLASLSSVTKGRFSTGRPVAVGDGALTVGFPSQIMCDLCTDRRPELERVLAEVFGRPVPVRLVVDAGTTAAGSGHGSSEGGAGAAEEPVDLDDLVDAPDDRRSGVERLTEAFPGAEVLDGG